MSLYFLFFVSAYLQSEQVLNYLHCSHLLLPHKFPLLPHRSLAQNFFSCYTPYHILCSLAVDCFASQVRLVFHETRQTGRYINSHSRDQLLFQSHLKKSNLDSKTQKYNFFLYYSYYFRCY